MMLVNQKDVNVSAESYEDLIEMLQGEQLEAAQVKVPWFIEKMPSSYFKQVEPKLRDQHLAALVALYDFDAVPELQLGSPDGSTLTMINGGPSSPQRLAKHLGKLPTDAALSGMQMYTSTDNEVSLNIFRMQSKTTPSNPGYMSAELEEYLEKLNSGSFENDQLHAAPAPYFEKEYLSNWLKEHCTQDYVVKSSPRRFCKQVELYHKTMARGEDEIGLDVEENWGGSPKRTMVTIAMTNVMVMAAIRRLTDYMASKNLNIVRTHLDVLKGPLTEEEADLSSGASSPVRHEDMLRSNNVAMFRILVEPSGDEDMAETNKTIASDVSTVAKWMDDRSLALLQKHQLSAREAELIIALSDLAHGVLAPKDSFEFARSNVELALTGLTRMGYTREIVDAFMNRFDPSTPHAERNDETFHARLDEIRSRLVDSGELDVAQTVLSTVIDLVKGVKRTNLFVPHRFGVSFRLDPAVCVQHILDDYRTETPYGVFFVHGRRFAGFHLRFRDIARGGLRLVTPNGPEMQGVESARQLVECYDLAAAQQLKNKDIAEGGAKAVCLIDTDGYDQEGRDHVMRKSLKAMVNSILDIITPNEKDESIMVDHMGGMEEFIYFGPDEQVTPEHINWIVRRAAQRGYPMPSAFMSSKPDTGFNHKEFGVTSEGVAVFLDEALRATGVDTSKPFTVKITGGPNGDLGGNLLKILNRDYGENPRIVGLADGNACIECPSGLDWDELLRLVKEDLALDSYDTSKLGSDGVLHLANTPAGINMRNTMHNRVVADAFVPAGGRPATINDSNWSKYLLSDGTPSSPLIVEGANLFLTPLAREKLSEAGCVIVKDSSANKTGVMCSSMEIICSMILTKDEFLQNKPELVRDVLAFLRDRASLEAQLMFREYKAHPKQPLTPVSQRISHAINRSTDSFAMLLEKLDEAEMSKIVPVIKDKLPAKLMELGWSRFEDNVPPAYIRYQLACLLASELVYSEGVDYALSIGDDVLGDWLLKYLQGNMKSDELATNLNNLSAEDQELVADILRKGGARTMLDHNLDK